MTEREHMLADFESAIRGMDPLTLEALTEWTRARLDEQRRGVRREFDLEAEVEAIRARLAAGTVQP